MFSAGTSLVLLESGDERHGNNFIALFRGCPLCFKLQALSVPVEDLLTFNRRYFPGARQAAAVSVLIWCYDSDTSATGLADGAW